MKRETFSHEKFAGLKATQKTNKTIVLPFDEKTYSDLIENKSAYKAFVKGCIEACPELFPNTINSGWSLYGFTKDSVKQGIRVRRIVTDVPNEVWQIRPCDAIYDV
jgi:hypothetical protein